MELTTVIQD